VESSSRFRTTTQGRTGHKPIEPRVGRPSAPVEGADRCVPHESRRPHKGVGFEPWRPGATPRVGGPLCRVSHESRRPHKGVGFGLASGGPVRALGRRALPATSAYFHGSPGYRKGRRTVGASGCRYTPRVDGAAARTVVSRGRRPVAHPSRHVRSDRVVAAHPILRPGRLRPTPPGARCPVSTRCPA
jgi:hypothetical protein